MPLSTSSMTSISTSLSTNDIFGIVSSSDSESETSSSNSSSSESDESSSEGEGEGEEEEDEEEEEGRGEKKQKKEVKMETLQTGKDNRDETTMFMLDQVLSFDYSCLKCMYMYMYMYSTCRFEKKFNHSRVL